MKTQIITLASHDDLISVRDRMSWAKSPRILLVWPAYEQVPLGALDLRILQQHARQLGAQMGLVTRAGSLRRDAESFGIPVFHSTAEAQRAPWSARSDRLWRRTRRPRNQVAELRAMNAQLHSEGAHWTSAPIPRIGCFTVAVLAVLSLASLFVPRATVILSPISMEQSTTIAVDILPGSSATAPAGTVPAEIVPLTLSGTRTMRVESRSEIPVERAAGTVRFQNLTPLPIVIPSGTVVYSVVPASVRFATTAESQLEGRINAVLDVPIQALEAGKIGNVPANAIQGIEGALGASVAVSNPAPTTGGQDAVEALASQADREQLQADLLSDLQTEAQSSIEAGTRADEVSLPDTLMLASIGEELFDPPAGEPGAVLSLTMSVTYNVLKVKQEDLQQLAEAALDASMPPDYAPRAGTLVYRLVSAPTPSQGNGARFDLQIERVLVRKIEVDTVNRIVRGRARAKALTELRNSLPLATPPEIRMAPDWWPWLPLIPFRIEIIAS